MHVLAERMPGESKAAAPAAEPAPATPKKKPASSSGKAALAKVTVLDGSILEVTIDVSNMEVRLRFGFILTVPFHYSAKREDEIY